MVPIVLAGLLLALVGCSSSLQSQVVIHAPPERVWQVLTDLEAYPEWNPFFVNVEGKLVVGESLAITMQPVGKDRQSFSPELLGLEPGRKLVWRGRLWVPWLFDGTHTFSIERIDARSVRFIQHEDFAGIFVPFVGFEPYHQGWELMNAALKSRAEGRGATTISAGRRTQEEEALLPLRRPRDRPTSHGHTVTE
ncbi:MAG TPA: SRPBCC domain-containing protein [Polyangiaceae bacterium]